MSKFLTMDTHENAFRNLRSLEPGQLIYIERHPHQKNPERLEEIVNQKGLRVSAFHECILEITDVLGAATEDWYPGETAVIRAVDRVTKNTYSIEIHYLDGSKQPYISTYIFEVNRTYIPYAAPHAQIHIASLDDANLINAYQETIQAMGQMHQHLINTAKESL